MDLSKCFFLCGVVISAVSTSVFGDDYPDPAILACKDKRDSEKCEIKYPAGVVTGRCRARYSNGVRRTRCEPVPFGVVCGLNNLGVKCETEPGYVGRCVPNTNSFNGKWDSFSCSSQVSEFDDFLKYMNEHDLHVDDSHDNRVSFVGNTGFSCSEKFTTPNDTTIRLKCHANPFPIRVR